MSIWGEFSVSMMVVESDMHIDNARTSGTCRIPSRLHFLLRRSSVLRWVAVVRRQRGKTWLWMDVLEGKYDELDLRNPSVAGGLEVFEVVA